MINPKNATNSSDRDILDGLSMLLQHRLAFQRRARSHRRRHNKATIDLKGVRDRLRSPRSCNRFVSPWLWWPCRSAGSGADERDEGFDAAIARRKIEMNGRTMTIKTGSYAICGLVLACGLALTPMSAAVANDSSVELAVGGVTFTQTPDVSMEEEVLTITPDTVTVLYRFLNQTAAPVTLTVGFPLPALDLADQDVMYAIPGSDPVNFVDFKTKIDGKPIKFDVVQRARLGGKDVTAEVQDAGLPLALLGGDTQQHIAALAPDVRAKLIGDGLLIPIGSDEKGEQLYGPGWLVTTAFTRKQVFPPGQTGQRRASLQDEPRGQPGYSVAQGVAQRRRHERRDRQIPQGLLLAG